MLKLDKSFTLTVPLYDNDGNATPQAVYDRLNAITKTVGGTTVQKVHGEWIDSEGTVYVDENAVYTWSFGDGSADELEYKFNLAILGLFSILNQEAVMFKLGETAYIEDKHSKDYFRGMENAIKTYLKGDKNNG